MHLLTFISINDYTVSRLQGKIAANFTFFDYIFQSHLYIRDLVAFFSYYDYVIRVRKLCEPPALNMASSTVIPSLY